MCFRIANSFTGILALLSRDERLSLQTSIDEIDPNACGTPDRGSSRPFEECTSCGSAVRVIKHMEDEVMKVFQVS